MFDQVRNTKIYIIQLAFIFDELALIVQYTFMKKAKGNEQIINAIEKLHSISKEKRMGKNILKNVSIRTRGLLLFDS